MAATATSLGLAMLLGLRHGMDADHLAAIDGLSRLNFSIGRPRLAHLSGVLFSTGHGCIVLAAAALLAATGSHVPEWLDGLGSSVSIALLLWLGLVNLRHAVKPAGTPQPAGLLASWAMTFPFGRNVAGGLAIGALFALSFDTFTLAAWFGAASASNASGTATLFALALAFVGGMILCDGANGLWIAHLIGRSASFGARSRRFFSTVVACTALAVAGIGIARLSVLRVDRWFDQHGLWASAALMAAVVTGYFVVQRRRDISHVTGLADTSEHVAAMNFRAKIPERLR